MAGLLFEPLTCGRWQSALRVARVIPLTGIAANRARTPMQDTSSMRGRVTPHPAAAIGNFRAIFGVRRAGALRKQMQ